MRQPLMNHFMNPRNWWKSLALVGLVSLVGLLYTGISTYTQAPPVPDFVLASGKIVVQKAEIISGQRVYQKYALMDYGSMFGDGGIRGPDYTADALHSMAQAMRDHYSAMEKPATDDGEARRAIAQLKVNRELKANTYRSEENRVVVSEARAVAFEVLKQRYQGFFDGSNAAEGFKPAGYIKDQAEIRSLSAFFFWGAWVCSTSRPGETGSYTHNWPYDPEAGNTPPPAILLWSVAGILALILGLGLCLYFYGRFDKLDSGYLAADNHLLTHTAIAGYEIQQLQRAAYKFFAAATLIFLLQVLAGVLTVHDFVGLVRFGSYNISHDLPVTVTRSWHVQLSLLWISLCWIGVSIFILPFINNAQPRGQKTLVNILFSLLLIIAVGAIAGIFAGPHGLLGKWWLAFGHQGWEFVEMGRFWQVFLWLGLVLWSFIIFRGVRGVLNRAQRWALPNWLLYSVIAVTLLMVSGFLVSSEGNFVISDFWRWCVIHMWAEAFFEVLTTIVAGYLMVLMGLVNAAAVTRVVFLATLLFLGSGLMGIAHNFYWNAKPVGTLAMGSVFSTLQVVPLVLLTIEAWRFRNLGNEEKEAAGVKKSFAMPVVFLFLIAVNFWNFLGAGVFGLIINLPIVNYYEHGTYLTVNHGHAALMGVYGNLSLAALFFCCGLLKGSELWAGRIARLVFWSINAGLALMVFANTLPAGILQLQVVAENSFWYARTQTFIQGKPFQIFTWLRIFGGALFLLGGVFPLLYLMLQRNKRNR